MFARKKTFGDRLKDLFGLGTGKEEFFEGPEDLLLEADLGTKLSLELVESVRKKAKTEGIRDDAGLRSLVLDAIVAGLKTCPLEPDTSILNCFLFLGVNGVGKTTSIAKYASYLKQKNPDFPIVLAAGDTFRSAATEQLTLHGQRLGLRTVSQGSGADPAAVIYDALDSVRAKGSGLVLADTAGRLHNKAHLIKELEKIDKIVRQKIGSEGQYKKVLVLDATTGQNARQQAEVFHESVGVDALILSKYDSTAKGGIVVSIARDLGLPVAFVGTGEAYGDLTVFSPEDFARGILER